MIKGHITIYKIYKDGTQETVLDNHNLITNGLKSSFCDVLSNNGSMNAEDFRPRYFAVGTSSVNYDVSLDTSTAFYNLSAPLSWEEYGLNTFLHIEKLDRAFAASSSDGGETYEELYFTSATLSSTIFSSSPAYFSHTQDNYITKWFYDALESQIVLDETTANGKTIAEIGLFAKNPQGLGRDHPLLMAYHKFTGIPKTDEFSLVFNWSIGFLGISPAIDGRSSGDGDGDRDYRPTRWASNYTRTI